MRKGVKQSPAKQWGYDYEIWIYDKFGNCIEQYT
jgi:hypothetical protein